MEISNKPPLSNSDNRDEYFLVNMTGLFVPVVDEVFFGLLNSELSSDFYTFNKFTSFNPEEIYLRYGYYDKPTLLKELYDVDNHDNNMLNDKDYLAKIDKAISENYNYCVCNETTIRHMIIGLAMANYVKKVVLVFDHEVTAGDQTFLTSIIPEDIIDKFETVHGDFLDILKENHNESKDGFKYTSLFMNSIKDATTIIDNFEEYNVSGSYIFLMNSTENCILDFNDGLVSYKVGSDEIKNKLYEEGSMIPKKKIGFVRFEPFLYTMQKALFDTIET